jgi:hypothetical protein
MKPLHFIKDITAAPQDYKSFPFNFSTMRARRKVQKELGCAYVSAVAKILAESHGETISERDIDGTKWSYYAYSANRAHEVYQKRVHERTMTKQGFRPASQFVKAGDVVLYLNGGEQFKGRVVDGDSGIGIMPPKSRRKYIPLRSAQIWAKPITQ